MTTRGVTFPCALSGGQGESMASETTAPSKEDDDGAPRKRSPETTPDGQLLSNNAVREMIEAAKKRGYVTYQQINAVLPSQEVTSEQIEDVLTVLYEMGVDTIEQENAGTEENERADEPEGDDRDTELGDTELVQVVRAVPSETRKSVPGER